MEILSKKELIRFINDFIKSSPSKPLMIWCGSNPSFDNLDRELRKNEVCGVCERIDGEVQPYYLDKATYFLYDRLDADQLAEQYISYILSYFKETGKPLVCMVNDYSLPAKSSLSWPRVSPFVWGTLFDYEFVENNIPPHVSDSFIHVCYMPSVSEWIEEMEHDESWEGLGKVLIDYARTQSDQVYFDPWYLNKYYPKFYNIIVPAMHAIKNGRKNTTEDCNKRLKSLCIGGMSKRLNESLLTFLADSEYGWLIDSTKKSPEGL